MKPILVTGATGFIGRTLCGALVREGLAVRGTLRLRERGRLLPPGVRPVCIGPIGRETAWQAACSGVDTVVHLAARVHVMQETAVDPLAQFRAVNVEGTERLAREAAAAGVRRLVFLSTVGVNGNESGEVPYTEDDEPKPHNPYAVSKLEAERRLLAVGAETGLEVVIVRAPLVYGAGNPGNFLTLMQLIEKRVPLPLAAVANRKSMIYVGNLVHALSFCIFHICAAGRTYLVADGEEVATPELIRRTAAHLGVAPRLFAAPPGLLRLAARVAGQSAAYVSLTGSLVVDTSRIRRELGWQAPYTLEEGLRETARWFRAQLPA